MREPRGLAGNLGVPWVDLKEFDGAERSADENCG